MAKHLITLVKKLAQTSSTQFAPLFFLTRPSGLGPPLIDQILVRRRWVLQNKCQLLHLFFLRTLDVKTPATLRSFSLADMTAWSFEARARNRTQPMTAPLL